MRKMRTIAVLAVLLAWQQAHAESACFGPDFTLPADWSEPYPAHRVVGNLYAVGNAGLSVFLITTDEGYVLVNTGLQDSAAMISNNVESLGFSMQDVKLLLTTQVHFDYTAALAEIKAATGAQMWATPADATVLEDGGAGDAHFGKCTSFTSNPCRLTASWQMGRCST